MKKEEKRKNVKHKKRVLTFMIKYIAYCRKSTDEPDRQILSIEAQVAELKEFALREKLEIVEWITESKTAKKPGRYEFARMLRLLDSGVAQGIVSWHADRLARNSIDGGQIVYMLDTGKLLDLKFPSFWFENTPQGKFMLSIAFGQSKYYVDNLSENVKRGNRQKLRMGNWPNKAPFGYLNDSGTKTILVDKKRALYVTKVFKQFATGGYTYVDIGKYLTDHSIRNSSGTTLHLDKVKRILTDPFYYGVMRFNGELYEGKHQPIISKKLFDVCQLAISKHSRKQKIVKHSFDYLGLAKCGECGASITAEKHHKHYRRTNRDVEYVYYRCSKKRGVCSQKYVEQASLVPQLRKIVGRASLSPFAANKFNEWAQHDAEAEQAKSTEEITTLKQQLAKTTEQLDRLLEGYLDKVISSAEYMEKKNKLVEYRATLTDKIKTLESKGVEWLEPFGDFVNGALQAHQIARAKTQGHDLLIMAKTVGSTFILQNRQLTANYKIQGYLALQATATAWRADNFSTNIPNLLRD